MSRIEFDTQEAAYVDTPNGIFTAAGVWFHTTEEALRQYAEPVLARVPLPSLLQQAEVWLRSDQTLVLWVLPLALLLVPPLPAALGALTLYVGWRGLSPSFVSLALLRVFRLLDRVWLQGLYYVLVLSVLAGAAQHAALGLGLGGFILLRWGVVARLTQPLVRRLWASLYSLPVSDQVLRAVIIRTALKYRLSLPELDRMEREIHRHMGRKP